MLRVIKISYQLLLKLSKSPSILLRENISNWPSFITRFGCFLYSEDETRDIPKRDRQGGKRANQMASEQSGGGGRNSVGNTLTTP